MSSDRADTAMSKAGSDVEYDVLVRAGALGKCYEIYEKPVDRLKQTIFRGRRTFYREFWALRAVSLELRRGESLGVIGRNGSGKSTLLQIIAGTLAPTEGTIEVAGRTHALLELGSGFNPEFTGRENVFLNGSILGVNTRTIKSRFDEIAAFADIGRFIDQPVKTYSTGMVLRLAFAVQVLLEPQLLIVDEALAVGDAAFQAKCMNRMRRLLEREVAVILVSHDIDTIRMFCDRVVWMDEGRIVADGPPKQVTMAYLQFLFDRPDSEERHEPPRADEESVPAPESADDLWRARRLQELAGGERPSRWGSGELQVSGVVLHDGDGEPTRLLETGRAAVIEFDVTVREDVSCKNIGLAFSVRNSKGLDVITYTTYERGERLPPPRRGQRLRMAASFRNVLAPGEYVLTLAAERIDGDRRHYFDFVENAMTFRVNAPHAVYSLVYPPMRHELKIADPPGDTETA